LQRKKKSIFYLIVESITFLLLCNQQKKSVFEKVPPGHISISIHKPLASIENQWQYYSFGLEGSFCRFFHPEVLFLSVCPECPPRLQVASFAGSGKSRHSLSMALFV
jgi:hypothetical protein